MGFTTKNSLLTKIRKGDEFGWEEFYETYFPLIWIRGREDHGLSRTETEDLAQDVMVSVFSISGRFEYDPAKGRFRDYLRTIIDRRAYDIMRKRDGARNTTDLGLDSSWMSSLPDEKESQDDKWQSKWQEHILKQALIDLRSRIEPRTYQAFELYMLQGWKLAKVAEFLKMSPNSVSVARNRAIATIKDIISEMKEQ